jgi:regulatory protein
VTGEGPGSSGPAAARRRKATYAERREQRARVDDVGDVLDAAARYLEARPRSVAEVRRRLATAGYRPELVDGAIARLLELRYLDDETFARAWVESRDRARPRGELALRRELRAKGIEATLIDTVLDERRTPGPETEIDVDSAAAERLLERHARALGRELDPRRRRQRAYALLARNGFDPETCGSAVTAWMAGQGSADAD